MQTFLPYPDFKESAKVLDNRRLGKQRIEAKQILEINLIKISEKVFYCLECESFLLELDDMHKPVESKMRVYKGSEIRIPWENHPAVLMWRGFEYSLALYGWIICEEWKSRGFKDSQQSFFQSKLKEIDVSWDYNPPIIDINYYPSWYKDSDDLYALCLSHQSNLLRKDWNYYIKYFGNTIQDSTLPYYWPVTKEK